MSFFDTLKEYTVSPFKVGMNLAEDFVQTRDLPNPGDIASAFRSHDNSHLPNVELTTNTTATEVTERLMEQGTVTISRASDVYLRNTATKPFTLSQYGG